MAIDTYSRAFPAAATVVPREGVMTEPRDAGMSARLYIASLQCAAIMANPNTAYHVHTPEELTAFAYKLADALMEQQWNLNL